MRSAVVIVAVLAALVCTASCSPLSESVAAYMRNHMKTAVARIQQRQASHLALAGLKDGPNCPVPDSDALVNMVNETALQLISQCSAQCKASSASYYLAAEIALANTASTTFSPDCTSSTCDSRACVCTTTYSYTTAGRAAFLAAITGVTAQPGKMIGLDNAMRLYMSMSANGQSISEDSTTGDKGQISAISQACTDADVQKIVNAVQVIMSAFNQILSGFSNCIQAYAASQNVKLQFSMGLTLSETFYTQFDTNNMPVQSSAISGQGTAAVQSAAAGLAAPAHVWLFTAVAAVAMLFWAKH